MFVSTAFAQSAAVAQGSSDMFMSFLPLVLIFVVFYILLLRPQQQKAAEHKAMLEAVRRGDRVVTGGGIIGTIIKIGPDDEVQVEIAEGVRVRCLRSTLNLVLSKPEPAKSGETVAEPGAAADQGKEGPMRQIGKFLGRK
jgi:preprotein translocase subunit YajC